MTASRSGEVMLAVVMLKVDDAGRDHPWDQMMSAKTPYKLLYFDDEVVGALVCLFKGLMVRL